MDIYIDLSLLFYIFGGIAFIYYLKVICIRKIKWYSYLIFSLISALQISIFYSSTFIFYLIYFLIIFIFFYFQHKKKFYFDIFLYVLFYGLSTYLLILFQDINHLYSVIYISATNEILYLLYFPFIFLIIFISNQIITKFYKLFRLKEDVILIIDEKKYKFNAYLDTGNNLNYHSLPVIFLANKKYKFKRQDEIEISLKTIIKEEHVSVFISKIFIPSKKEYFQCYVCLKDEIDNFNNCDILLNNLFY